LKAAVAEGRAVVCIFAINGRDGPDTMVSGAILNGRASAADLAQLLAATIVKATETPELLAHMIGGEKGGLLLDDVCRLIDSPTLAGGRASGAVTRRED
jgi:hypothetical protein